MKFPSLAKQRVCKWERFLYCKKGGGDEAAELSCGWHFVVAVLGTITELSFTWLWSPGAASATQGECWNNALGMILLDVCSGICLLWDKLDGEVESWTSAGLDPVKMEVVFQRRCVRCVPFVCCTGRREVFIGSFCTINRWSYRWWQTVWTGKSQLPVLPPRLYLRGMKEKQWNSSAVTEGFL